MDRVFNCDRTGRSFAALRLLEVLMLAVLFAVILGQSAGSQPVMASEPLYQACLERHTGSSKVSKCRCIATFLTMNPADPQATRVAFALLFQYYQPALWEIQNIHGVDQDTAYSATVIKGGRGQCLQILADIRQRAIAGLRARITAKSG
jgi:hypothetical protein